MSFSLERPRILVVDDDLGLRRLLQRFLGGNGFEVRAVSSAREAERALSRESFDLMVLDIMMPSESGIDFLARLRREEAVPVLLYTALDKTDTRLAGLKLGADDYLVKTAPPEELVLRIRAILRRTREGAPDPAAEGGATDEAGVASPCYAGFTFDAVRGRLARDHREYILPESQARLFALLSDARGAVMTRETLAAGLAVAGDGTGVGESLRARSVDAQVSRLRLSLKRMDRSLAACLQTLRGRGYRLLPDDFRAP